MPLVVWTSRLGVADPDALDVSRKGGDPLGVRFAPSWGILRSILALRRAGGESAEQWAEYERKYLNELCWRYRDDQAPFLALLACPRVVLQCYCAGDPARCHRTVLAGALVRMGATYMGELPARWQDQDLFE